jgi:co-chaperonin GroES (HSP10)
MLTGKVLPGKVLIAPLFEDKKTSSGIILETANATFTNIGIVIMVGATTNGTEPLVKPGDKVMFDPRQAKELELEVKQYFLLHATEIQYIY